MSDRPHLTPDAEGRVHIYLDEHGRHPGFTCDATRVEVVFHPHPDQPVGDPFTGDAPAWPTVTVAGSDLTPPPGWTPDEFLIDPRTLRAVHVPPWARRRWWR